jgi:hypothetical protein
MRWIPRSNPINEPLQNTIAYNPAPEAIGQMRVITGNAEAEYGNVNGGEVIMVTKSGTNKFHGSLHSYYKNQDLTANTWNNNYNHLAKGVFHQNQFGASFGSISFTTLPGFTQMNLSALQPVRPSRVRISTTPGTRTSSRHSLSSST